MLQPAAEQARLEGAGQAVLAEHDEDQHVGGHRHRQHERPVEQAAAGEVPERHEHAPAPRRARACRRRRPTPSNRLLAQRSGQQRGRSGRRRRSPPRKLAGSATSGPTTTSATQGADDGPARTVAATVAGRGRDRRGRGLSSSPPRASSAMASASSGPAASTSMGSVFTSAQSAMCASAGHVRVRGELAAGDDLLLGVAATSGTPSSATASAFVVGPRDHADAGHVGVRAGAVLVGPRRGDREVRVLLEHRAPR